MSKIKILTIFLIFTYSTIGFTNEIGYEIEILIAKFQDLDLEYQYKPISRIVNLSDSENIITSKNYFPQQTTYLSTVKESLLSTKDYSIMAHFSYAQKTGNKKKIKSLSINNRSMEGIHPDINGKIHIFDNIFLQAYIDLLIKLPIPKYQNTSKLTLPFEIILERRLKLNKVNNFELPMFSVFLFIKELENKPNELENKPNELENKPNELENKPNELENQLN